MQKLSYAYEGKLLFDFSLKSTKVSKCGHPVLYELFLRASPYETR